MKMSAAGITPNPLYIDQGPPQSFDFHPMKQLPQEILGIIMNMAIHSLKDWENFRKVCKGTKAIAQSTETARILAKFPMNQLGLPIDKAIVFFPKFFEQLPPNLSLDLSNCQYKSSKSNEGSPLAGITALTSLKNLNAASTAVNNEDVNHLSEMTSLKKLNLSNTKV